MSETDDPERKWTEGIDPALTSPFTAEDVEALEDCIGYGDRDTTLRARAAVAKIRALLPAQPFSETPMSETPKGCAAEALARRTMLQSVEPFCPICGKAFITVGVLIEHTARVHDGKTLPA